MGRQRKTSGKKRRVLKILLSLLLILAIGALAVLKQRYVQVDGRLIPRDCAELDLRTSHLTVEDYEKIAAELPKCRILWNVPVGSSYYSSTATSIVLDEISDEVLSVLGFFEDLREIDATSVSSAAELEALRQAAPGCAIRWMVYMAGSCYDPGETILDLSGTSVTADELLENLARFDAPEQVALEGVALTDGEKAELTARYPGITFIWDVELLGEHWLNTDTCLSFAGEAVDADALAAAAGSFPQVERIDLTGCGLSLEALTAIQRAYPGAFLRSEVTLYGQTFTTDATFLDFNDVQMDSTDQVAALAELMPYLEKVDMCNCGISNEDMDALNKQFENIMFVWKVYFSVYSLRTDATYFCASDLPDRGYVAVKMTDEQLEPLKYCTELIALDLGHMLYTDLSFLENMPKLQYLILVEAQFHDISPIGTLKELKYLELFVNTIDDLSPLLECKNLRHLNIGYTRGFDPSVLKEMVWLERLWYPGHGQDRQVINEIIAALPDTECYMPGGSPDGSTGNGWREAEVYFEMRDILSMHYMPGGTGTNALK